MTTRDQTLAAQIAIEDWIRANIPGVVVVAVDSDDMPRDCSRGDGGHERIAWVDVAPIDGEFAPSFSAWVASQPGLTLDGIYTEFDNSPGVGLRFCVVVGDDASSNWSGK